VAPLFAKKLKPFIHGEFVKFLENVTDITCPDKKMEFSKIRFIKYFYSIV